MVTIYATAAGDPGSNPALGKHGHVTTRSSSPGQPRRSPMRTFATKTISTGANGQKADGTSPFVGAVLKKLSCGVTPGLALAKQENCNFFEAETLIKLRLRLALQVVDGGCVKRSLRSCSSARSFSRTSESRPFSNSASYY